MNSEPFELQELIMAAIKSATEKVDTALEGIKAPILNGLRLKSI